MNILVFNCGSSSQGFKVYSVERNKPAKILIAGKAKNVAAKTQAKAYVIWDISGKTEQKYCDLSSHRLAAKEIIGILNSYSICPDAIGHRFVHGGKELQKTVRIDQKIRNQLVRCLPLAPIHNPNSFSVVEVCEDLLKDVPQYAVFDTAFHAQMPEASKRYAIPRPLAEKFGFQKFGFHGLSYQYVSAQASLFLERPLTELKLILCHLGSGGSSVTAMKDGKSIDTSMGFSPLAGLVMSSRCGDLDPEIVLELVRAGYSADEISIILNRESGLIGLSGFSSSLAEIIEAAENGDKSCQIAYDVYIQRLKKYLGAFTWLLNGADAIVFTDDIGETCWKMREKVFSGTDAMGIRLDIEKNKITGGSSPERISRPDSGVQIWVIPTDEESVILREVEAKILLDDN